MSLVSFDYVTSLVPVQSRDSQRRTNITRTTIIANGPSQQYSYLFSYVTNLTVTLYHSRVTCYAEHNTQVRLMITIPMYLKIPWRRDEDNTFWTPFTPNTWGPGIMERGLKGSTRDVRRGRLIHPRRDRHSLSLVVQHWCVNCSIKEKMIFLYYE